jgi:hypothetical protein
MDTSQGDLEEEEAISGTGEGDEIMEEAGEQEDGYSEFLGGFARSSLIYSVSVPWSCLVPT